MPRYIGIAPRIVLIGAIGIAATSACAQQPKVPFPLRAITLEMDARLTSTRMSSESGTIAGICRRREGSTFYEEIIKFSIEDGELRPVFTAPRPELSEGFPNLLLADNRILMSSRNYQEIEQSASSLGNVIVQLFDADLKTAEDITPSNYNELPQPAPRIFPAALWSERFGLALFIHDEETREVSFWQGKETLEEVQMTPPSLATGWAFISGRLAYTVLTGDGTVLAYDYEEGRMVESEAHRAIGSEVAQFIGEPQEKPVRYALAEGVAVFKWNSDYALVGLDGTRHLIERMDALGKRPGGSTRGSIEGMVLAHDPGALKTEGRLRPPNVINQLSSILPVSETQVGIFDVEYQRLIVISPPALGTTAVPGRRP
ncbi:hypothetical protein IIA79_00285 [bacterium]|nr:hypothetical protein [bacterium]